MFATILKASEHARISAPATPPKKTRKRYSALVDLRLERILSFGITRRGSIYMRYGTLSGRGCSFISFAKLSQALSELEPYQKLTAQIASAHLKKSSHLYPALAEWNNSKWAQDNNIVEWRKILPEVSRQTDEVNVEEAKNSLQEDSKPQHKPLTYDQWQRSSPVERLQQERRQQEAVEATQYIPGALQSKQTMRCKNPEQYRDLTTQRNELFSSLIAVNNLDRHMEAQRAIATAGLGFKNPVPDPYSVDIINSAVNPEAKLGVLSWNGENWMVEVGDRPPSSVGSLNEAMLIFKDPAQLDLDF